MLCVCAIQLEKGLAKGLASRECLQLPTHMLAGDTDPHHITVETVQFAQMGEQPIPGFFR